MINVVGMRLSHLAELVRSGQHSSSEITQAYLDRIEALNPKLNAYLEVFGAQAQDQARRADEEIRQGRVRSPIHGVPIAVKDIIDIEGHRTTAGGKLLPMGPALADAGVIERLRAAGAVLLGKLNLHEYAWGGTTDNPHFGRCINPWKAGYSPGGSSGGSGAAVAASLCAAALGTDTLGSVRIPSSYCGCAGIKTSFGLVSKRGVFPLSWSLDTVGPLASSVNDAAILLGVMAGPDSADPTSANREARRFDSEDPPDLAGTRLGVIRNYALENDGSTLGKVVSAAVQTAVDKLTALGCQRIDLDFPEINEMGTTAINITLADAAAIHQEHLRDHPDQIGGDVRTLLQMGAAMSGPQVAELHHQRTLLCRRFGQIMEAVDCLVSPTTPKPAHAFEAGGGAEVAKYTAPINLAGCPAVSVPCGFTVDGLPIGLQIVTPQFEDRRAVGIARAYEAATPWDERPPPGN